jgi:hypothetical protein
MQQALLATARTFTLGVEEEAHSSKDQPIDLDHTSRGSAPRELRQRTNLLPCCRGPLPSRPGSKGVAPTDKGLFTLEQGELLSKRQSQDARSCRPSRSDEHANAATASTGTAERKRENLGEAIEHGGAGESSEGGRRPSPATLPAAAAAHRSLQTGNTHQLPPAPDGASREGATP